MNSVIYDPEVRRFSVVTKTFAYVPKVVQEDWGKLTKNQQDQIKRARDHKAAKRLADIFHVKLENNGGNQQGNQQGGNGGGNKKDKSKSNNGNQQKDKKDDDKNRSSNHWTKNSPKIYAYEKLLTKNLDQLKNDNRVKEYKRLDDSYAVELPGDVWLSIYCTADGTYIITKLDMGDGGYFTSSRRFNAIVAGPKDLRNIITNLKSLEQPGFIRSLLLKGVGLVTGTDLVDKIKLNIW